jgi:hypothetical protein
MNLFELRELKPGYIRNFIIYVWWEVDGVLCVTKWVNVVKQGATVTIATCLCAVPCCQTYHKVVDYQKSGSENWPNKAASKWKHLIFKTKTQL